MTCVGIIETKNESVDGNEERQVEAKELSSEIQGSEIIMESCCDGEVVRWIEVGGAADNGLKWYN